MALSADKVRQFRNCAPIVDVPAVANDILYRGAALESTSGTADVLSGTGTFLGFSAAKCDNTGGAASAKDVAVIPEGEVLLSITGVSSEANNESTVYGTDDDTFTLTASGATSVGKIMQGGWVSGTNAWVKFQGSAQRSI